MTSQWEDHYGSEEPIPVSNEYDWPKDLNGRIEQASYSSGTVVRLFRADSGDAYAVHKGDVLDSGADHARVIQTAIDHVHQGVTYPNDPATTPVTGWVSGGGERYAVGQSIHLKDGVGLRNIDLDANSTDLGGSAVLDISTAGGPTQFIQAPRVDGVAARNNGNGPGIRSYQQAWGLLSNLTASGNAGDGIRLEGGFVTVINGHSRENDGNGYYIVNTSIAANINHLLVPNAAKNGKKGIHMDRSAERDDDNVMLTVELGNFGNNTEEALRIDNGSNSAIIRGNWFEPAGSGGIVVDGANTSSGWPPKHNLVEQNMTPVIDVGNAESTVLRRNFGPDYSGLDITIGSAAKQTYLKNNRYIGGGLTDNGTRTIRGDISTNNGDPSSAGEWSGHGYEGVVVYDTSGTRPYDAYRYVAGGWQSA